MLFGTLHDRVSFTSSVRIIVPISSCPTSSSRNILLLWVGGSLKPRDNRGLDVGEHNNVRFSSDGYHIVYIVIVSCQFVLYCYYNNSKYSVGNWNNNPC